jgi:hypothetical protein
VVVVVVVTGKDTISRLHVGHHQKAGKTCTLIAAQVQVT